MADEEIQTRKKQKKENNSTDNTMRKKEKKKKRKEETADVPIKEKKSKNNNKRKLQQQEEEGELDHDKPRAKQNKRNRNIVTDERFASVHFDPRFQRVPKKESKVQVDSRFAKMLTDKNFGMSSAPVDKRGKLKPKKEVNPLLHYYEEEKEEDDEEKEGKLEIKVSDDEDDDEDVVLIDGSESSSTDDEDEYDYDEENDQDLIQSDISRYLMASHDDTPLTEQETHRLAVVNMDWDHIKAVDLYVAINSCLPRGGQIFSVGIYPSEFGIKCMEVEAVHGPSALLHDNEGHSEDESESDDESIVNEKLRSYELNKLRYYYGVVVFDSSATANHVYKNLDGTELLRTSNVFDLRFIPESMEFKHPPRDVTTEAPTNYSMPDFHTRALQHSNVKLTWEEDEPRRTKILRRKFVADELDELNEYLASSGDSDAGEEKGESERSDNSDAEALSTDKTKKHKDREKIRELLLSGNRSGSDKDDDDDKDMEVTFNTELEDLSKRILEKKDKKSETVWEQVLRKKTEKKKARKSRSKYSSEDDSSESDVPEAADQPEDFFMEEEETLDSNTKKGKHRKSNKKEREASPDINEEQEATKAELELLFAEDQDGKDNGPKGYKLKPKKVKGKQGKEAAIEAKLPDVDPASDPRFSALFSSHLYALDPTDPQYKRSAAYARQQLGKRGIVKDTEQAEETMISSDQIDSDLVPIEKKERYELSSAVRSLKRNLGNLKKHTKGR